MPIFHKFLNKDWNNGFQTHNCILDTVPYEPEVIIIGTFNHGWAWNNADFFYGRGMYMWTILGNMFLHNDNLMVDRRTVNNNIPTLDQIFQICKNGKIVFADIVQGTKPQVPIETKQHSILVNGEYIWYDHKDIHLDVMGTKGLLKDNVEEIVKYINTTKSIKHIYFTFKSGSWLVEKKQSIIAQAETESACSIFTPTGNGFGQNLQQYPERAWSMAHCWIWNDLPHPTPINKPGYGHFNHNWLINNGVTPAHF
ncbi:hypothetical protein [Pontibacter chinhatensis]|uniref:Uncharacterized protein n=1 Tax=Pontibacter chinhatensis TaxID=1436961 RepID=A0A1I2ZS79_9BACT|nr:hypothetical protein [Pontibacter chinhatensis]SFH40560.1 hypothetical protein SAMN05421739_11812 [Pontibacter chinhatensis]